MRQVVPCVGRVVLLAAIMGCAPADDELTDVPLDVSALVSPSMANVVDVTWETERPSLGFVEYGVTPDLGWVTPMEATATMTHQRQLRGLTSDTDVYYRVVTVDGEPGEIQQIRTGPTPVGLPNLTVRGTGHDGLVVVPVVGSATTIVAFDAQGSIVWSRRETRDLDTNRARLSHDGESIIYNVGSVAGDPQDPTAIVYVSIDGRHQREIPVPLLAHDFVEHPDGTIGAIVVEYRDVDGVSVRGDSIVEIYPDGRQATVWSAWDCFDPAEDVGDDPQQGWTFANALDYDPVEQVYYLGMRNFSSIAKIPRQGRACEWVLGLTGNTFTFADGSQRFLHQHQFQVLGNRVLVFDNEGSIANESRVLEYELDVQAGIASQIGAYVADPPVFSLVLGDTMRLEDGDLFVNWSTAGQMERVDPSGQTTWTVNSNLGAAFAFHTLVPDLYGQ